MAKVTLNPLAKWELAWWLNNLELSNDRSIIPSLLKILLQADASKKRSGEMFKGMKTWDLVVKEGTRMLYQVSETSSHKFGTTNLQKNVEV